MHIWVYYLRNIYYLGFKRRENYRFMIDKFIIVGNKIYLKFIRQYCVGDFPLIKFESYDQMEFFINFILNTVS